jgi:NAD(P)-dependent dehydrogenase (short-subunit alcohol dehydrogenase family)
MVLRNRRRQMAQLDAARNRTAVISGAGTGIGQATAIKLGSLGWRVAIGGRRVEKLTETAALVEDAGGTCFAHALDVSDPDSVETFFSATESRLGVATAVINNAATARYGPMDEFTPAEIFAEIGTKLLGSLYMARRGIQAMKRDGRGGDVLFVTSVGGVQPYPHHLPYAAANAGVEHAARTLRLELEGTGIRVNILRCGETLGTDFATREQENGRSAAASELWFRRGLLRHTGLMTPEMVAEAMVTALTLPMSYQYDLLAISPTAPIGEPPRTFEGWATDMMNLYMPS